jgi:hypothetical protein
MNAAMVTRLLSLIPERVVRAHSGTSFATEGAGSRHPERMVHLTKFLQWLSPLNALSREDQQVLGLLSASGRPVHAGDEEDESEAEPEAETWEPVL